MTPIERRYRFLLRAYPPAYSATHTEEILSTLLEAREHGARWPRLAEVAGILGHAADVRFAAATARRPREVALQAFELMCLFSLMICGLAAFQAVGIIVWDDRPPALSADDLSVFGAGGTLALAALAASMLRAPRVLSAALALLVLAFVIFDVSRGARLSFDHELCTALLLLAARRTRFHDSRILGLYFLVGASEILLVGDLTPVLYLPAIG